MTDAQAIDKLAFNLTVKPGMGEDEAKQKAADLIEWYNVAEPDIEDLKKLHALASAGGFESWECPTCEARVFCGNPEDWGDFQGVHQVDYTSYPGTKHTSERQCDYCRCHMVPCDD